MNTLRLAFLAALDESGISASSLCSSRSGQTSLSRYRVGSRDLTTTTLSKYLGELPPEAQLKFLEVMAGYLQQLGSVVGQRPKLSQLIELMDAESPADRKEAAEAMRLIVRKFLSENSTPANISKSTEDAPIGCTIE